MKFVNHRLQSPLCTQLHSPNQSPGLLPRWVVLHYTVVMGYQECLKWFCDPEKQVSIHFLIGEKGEIAQLVDCNAKAWHCGASQWQNVEGLNSYAIGIEFVNAGKLEQKEEGLESWFGQKISDSDVIWAKHQNENEVAPWQRYTEAQIQSAHTLIKAICEEYPIEDILGHDQIAPGRKIDPGPALDLSIFKQHLVPQATILENREN